MVEILFLSQIFFEVSHSALATPFSERVCKGCVPFSHRHCFDLFFALCSNLSWERGGEVEKGEGWVKQKNNSSKGTDGEWKAKRCGEVRQMRLCA